MKDLSRNVKNISGFLSIEECITRICAYVMIFSKSFVIYHSQHIVLLFAQLYGYDFFFYAASFFCHSQQCDDRWILIVIFLNKDIAPLCLCELISLILTDFF